MLRKGGREEGREGSHTKFRTCACSLCSRVSLFSSESLFSLLSRALCQSLLSLFSRASLLSSLARALSVSSLSVCLLYTTQLAHTTHTSTRTRTPTRTQHTQAHAHAHPPTCCLNEGSFSTSAHALDTHILERLILAGRQQDAPLWIWGAGRLLRKGGREEGREGSHESSHVRVRNGGRCPASLPGSPPPHVQEAAPRAHGVEGMTRGGRPPASQRAGACSEHSSVGGSGLRPPLR